ncbi:MAG: YfhL family 4Fe-4S dicluster ferredoxin [Chloroflexi bacterium]|nr:YfhL family 4Fe-4S dicluster ferredoxin [Chloroflexota bacterium]
MSYYIDDECILCGACEPECPNQAISEGDTKYIIDPEKCSECIGAFPDSRCSAVCPVDAPHPHPDRREAKADLLNRWRRFHPGEEPAAGTY